MITADGWLSWAHRVPGPADKVYSQPNTGEVYLPHDAVGYLRGWYSRLFDTSRLPDGRYTPNAAASVTGIILDEIDPATGDALVIQHYDFFKSCWASGARSINCRGIAFENERRRSNFNALPLPPHMHRSNVRIIRELAAWKGWTPRRPTGPNDMTATLMEHRESTRWGAEPTACPSGRIDWPRVLADLEEEDDEMKPVLVWNADKKQTWLLGPFGAVPILLPSDGGALEKLYGAHSAALSNLLLESLAPK